MIRALRPEDLDQVMQIWLDANLEAHCFLPESYWCDHMEEVRAALPAAQVFVYQDWEGLQGFAGLTGDYLAGLFVRRAARSRGIGRALLERAKERREILAGLADGSIDLCIGTHALLTEDVQYQKLGLVVTDEQHRFGVNQRAALSQKAEDPHLLVLSATPIPRTLALVIYGDLDVSVIDELPPGRQKVSTFALGESYRPRVQAFIRKLAAAGQQIFIVCPLVGEADQIPDERKAVTAYAKQLQEQVFPDLRVAVLHGKMKPREKEKV